MIQLELDGAAPDPPLKSSRRRVFFHCVPLVEGAVARAFVAQSARETTEAKVFIVMCKQLGMNDCGRICNAAAVVGEAERRRDWENRYNNKERRMKRKTLSPERLECDYVSPSLCVRTFIRNRQVPRRRPPASSPFF